MSYLFTSESVSEGHPDKVADQISDTILDQLLAYDSTARVAVETLVTTGQVVIAGEVHSDAYVDLQTLARKAIRKIGYTKSEYQFDAESCGILNAILEQSDDINRGVDRATEEEQGAGDQGMMFGYAVNETENYMPVTLELAHLLVNELAEIRREGKVMTYLRPDSKSQVTVEYSDDGIPQRIDTIVVSTQHAPEIEQEQIHNDVRKYVIDAIVDSGMVDDETKIYINPTGRFVIGGPNGDSGLTGRKIIVDTYGGAARHGGGAFSGKDCTKVDRSAAYAARYVAKNIVAAGIADRIEIQVSYAIGVSTPTSIMVDTFGTGKISDDKIVEIIRKEFDLRPAGIIKMLDLRRPIYKQTAAYGHFGRTDLDLPWERTDKIDALKAYL